MYSFQVSRKKRILQCTCAIFWALLAGGPIFGFAALKPILINEKIYKEVCDISVNSTGSFTQYSLFDNTPEALKQHQFGKLMSKNENNPETSCTAQDLKLNFIFTVGAVVTNSSAIVIGRVLDIYGPKICGFVGATLLYAACFVFIFAKEIQNSTSSYIDPYLLGYCAMSLGGPFAYMSSFHLSNTFPEKSGTILAFLNGAFDASSAIFLLYKLYYTNYNDLFSLNKFFKVYLFVPSFITLAQIFVMPDISYLAPPGSNLIASANEPAQVNGDDGTETEPLLDSHQNFPQLRRRDSIGDALKQHYVQEYDDHPNDNIGGVFGILHGYSAEFQMKTAWFYLLCAFTTIQMLRLNYFIATIDSQYVYLLGSDKKTQTLTRIFNAALPLGGVLSIPFVGYFLDHHSMVSSLTSLVGLSSIFGFAGLVGNFYFGIINICVFVVFRPYFYTTISDFCAKVFGFDTFGTVYGAVICVSGLFNFFQSALDSTTHELFNMNPRPVNLTLTIISIIIGVTTICYVQLQAKYYKEKKNLNVQSLSV